MQRFLLYESRNLCLKLGVGIVAIAAHRLDKQRFTLRESNGQRIQKGGPHGVIAQPPSGMMIGTGGARTVELEIARMNDQIGWSGLGGHDFLENMLAHDVRTVGNLRSY
jgi:hypothetical protein